MLPVSNLVKFFLIVRLFFPFFLFCRFLTLKYFFSTASITALPPRKKSVSSLLSSFHVPWWHILNRWKEASCLQTPELTHPSTTSRESYVPIFQRTLPVRRHFPAVAPTWRSRRRRRRHLDAAALVGNDIVCNGVTVALNDPLPVSLDGTRKKGRDEKVNPNRVAFTQMDNMIQFVFGAIVEQDFCYFFFFFFSLFSPIWSEGAEDDGSRNVFLQALFYLFTRSWGFCYLSPSYPAPKCLLLRPLPWRLVRQVQVLRNYSLVFLSHSGSNHSSSIQDRNRRGWRKKLY